MATKPMGILVDVSKCTGCRSCIAACHNWNKTSAETQPIRQTSRELSANIWVTLIREQEEMNNDVYQDKDRPYEAWYKYQCMHCLEPACLSACPAQAITKYENGPVVVDMKKCEGVRLCVEACPYHVPKFDENDKKVKKCTMCYTRINQDPPLDPACVQACPSKALTFGERAALIEYAKQNYAFVYGEKTGLGGSSIIYAADHQLNSKILLNVEATKRDQRVKYMDTFSHPLGMAMVAVGMGLGAVYLVKARSDTIAAEKALATRPTKRPTSKKGVKK